MRIFGQYVLHNYFRRPSIKHKIKEVGYEQSLFRTDLELRALQWDMPPQFRGAFTMAFNAYIEGNWAAARDKFIFCRESMKSEKYGPSYALLKFMEKYRYKAPSGWKGIRRLR